MSSLLILTLFAVAFTLALATPVPRNDIWTGGQLAENESERKRFDLPKDVSCYCGYNATILPNRRGHKTIQEAYAEFSHFVGLLTASPCSDHIGALVCFEYFPFPVGLKSSVLPCRETCESAQNEACTTLVKTVLPTGWAEHLDCTNYESTNQNETVCVGLEAVIRKDYSSCTSIEVSTTEKPTEVEVSTTEKPTEVEVSTTEKPTEVEVSTTEKPTEVEVSTTEKPTEVSTTEAPTKEEILCPTQCDTREKASSKTFVQNEQYSFAIKGTIVSKTDATSYEVTVEETLNVETCLDDVMTAAINLPDVVTVTCCKDLSESLNEVRLIAGIYTGTQEEGYELTVGCTKATGLVAPWKSNKFAYKAVTKGNSERSKKC